MRSRGADTTNMARTPGMPSGDFTVSAITSPAKILCQLIPLSAVPAACSKQTPIIPQANPEQRLIRRISLCGNSCTPHGSVCRVIILRVRQYFIIIVRSIIMHTKHLQLPPCFLCVVLIGLVLLGSGELTTAEQRRRTTPRRYVDTDSRHSGNTETVLPGNTNSWRPYTNSQVLVTLGMSKAEVLLKAGNPALEDVVSHGTDGHLNQTV